MKKVIIHGVRNIELRRSIEYFMDDDYEIAGYSDGHYPYDILDGKRFFPHEELKDQEYDFIVLAEQSSSAQAEIKTILSMLGTPPEKIIRPVLLAPGKSSRIYPDIIENIERCYKGERNLIFGLSYSYEGIHEKELAEPFFNCSFPGADLYYCFGVYNYMEERRLLPKLGKVLLVAPYYFFDYDMSMALSEYTEGLILATRKLDDWHHYQSLPQGPEYVANFRMFGKKYAQFYHVPLWKFFNYHVCAAQEGSCMLEPIWFKDHEETVKENRDIFLRFFQKMATGGGIPVIVVPPFYMRACSTLSKAAVQAKKKKFYGILSELEGELGPIRVYDYLDAVSGQRELFREVTHLNARGAAEFTKLLSRDVLN